MDYNKIVDKLKKIVRHSYQDNNHEVAFAAISALAYIYYQKNQLYTDDFLESYTKSVTDDLKLKLLGKDDIDNEIVFFYDGFGLDGRGLAYIYLKALCTLNKKIVYLTKHSAKGKQPLISALLNIPLAKMVYFDDNKGWVENAKAINDIILKFKPAIAFIYIPPWDSSAVGIFGKQCNLKRIQINLTDHAFWLGRDMFDICLEFREYGYSISKDYRLIPEKKLIMLPFYPHIEECEYEGLPFSLTGKKLIFSGGSLYKTLSSDNKYYIILDEILSVHKDVVFLYAGGTENEKEKLNLLINKYKGRVYWIKERKDFFKIIEKCYLYLNTYPYMGGLMTQYAVAAGKIPITLKNGRQTGGVLLNEDSIDFYYNTMDDLLSDVHKMLSDENYLRTKEMRLNNCLMTEDRFTNEIHNILEKGKTEVAFTYKKIGFGEIVDMRKTYEDRFQSVYIEKAIVRKKNKSLIIYFPLLFLKRFLKVKLGLRFF